MKTALHLLRVSRVCTLAFAALLLGVTTSLRAQYQITTLGGAITENFDTLQANTGATASNNNLNVINFTGSLATTNSDQRNNAWTINPGNSNFGRSGPKGNFGPGTNSSLGVYAAGNNATTTDRALMFQGGGNGTTMSAVAQFTNVSGSTLTSLIIGYTGEQWQAQGSRPSFITVSYSTTSATAGFTAINSLNFNALYTANGVNTGTGATNNALNGDASSNRSVFSTVNISGLNLSNASSIWISFTYQYGASGSGSAQGLAIDDLSLTFDGAAPAASLTWSGSSGDTWNTSSAKFTSNTATWDNTANATALAVFDSASNGQTVNVGTITAGGLQFGTGGVTLAGGTLTDGNSSGGLGVEVTTVSDTATISTTLSGSNGLTKTGAGTLVLGGTQSSLTGTVTVSAGTLQTTTGALANNNNITNNATVEFAQSSTGSYTGTLTNNGTFVKSGAGNLTITNAVGGSGATNITGGTITAGTGAPIASGALTMSSGTTLNLNSQSASAASLALTGATISNVGTLTLTGSLTTSADSTSTTISGGTLALGSTTHTVSVADGGAASDLVISSALTGSNTLTKTGAGTLDLSGSNSGLTGAFSLGLQGATGTEGGTVIIHDANSLGTNGTASAFRFNSGTLSVASSLSLGLATSIGGRDGTNGASTPTITGSDLTLGATSFFKATSSTGTLNLDVDNNTTISGTFGASTGTGSVTGIVFGGTGVLTLSGSSNAFTESVTLADSLTLQVDTDSALGTTAGGTTVASGTVLKLNAVDYTTAEALTLNGSGISNGGALVNSGTSTYAGAITLGSNASINAGGGSLTLTGGVTKDGTVLTLTGGGTINVNSVGISGSSANSDLIVDGTTVNVNVASTYNGPTFITNSGVLNAGDDNALSTGVVHIGSSSTLGIGAHAINNDITFDMASGSVTASGGSLGGTISGTGSLTGPLTFAATAKYVVDISAGALDHSLTLNGGTLTLNPSFTLDLAGVSTSSFATDSVQTWVVIDTTGGGTISGSSLTLGNIDGAFASLGSFSTEISASNVTLLWTPSAPIPEPSTYAALLGLAALAGALYRRQRRATQ